MHCDPCHEVSKATTSVMRRCVALLQHLAVQHSDAMSDKCATKLQYLTGGPITLMVECYNRLGCAAFHSVTAMLRTSNGINTHCDTLVCDVSGPVEAGYGKET